MSSRHRPASQNTKQCHQFERHHHARSADEEMYCCRVDDKKRWAPSNPIERSSHWTGDLTANDCSKSYRKPLGSNPTRVESHQPEVEICPRFDRYLNSEDIRQKRAHVEKQKRQLIKPMVFEVTNPSGLLCPGTKPSRSNDCYPNQYGLRVRGPVAAKRYPRHNHKLSADIIELKRTSHPNQPIFENHHTCHKSNVETYDVSCRGPGIAGITVNCYQTNYVTYPAYPCRARALGIPHLRPWQPPHYRKQEFRNECQQDQGADRRQQEGEKRPRTHRRRRNGEGQ